MAKVELIVLVKAVSGQTSALKQEMVAMLEPTHAETGCEFYRVYESSTEGHLFFHELWTSQEDLDRHMKSPHFMKFEKAIQPLLAEPLGVNFVTESKG